MLKTLFVQAVLKIPSACRHTIRNRPSMKKLKPIYTQSRVFSTGSNPQESSGSDLSEVNVERIAGGDPAAEKLLKMLILEVDIFRQDGQLVPDTITESQWAEMLLLKTRSSRLRYLSFLFKNEKKQENKVKRQAERRLEREEKAREADESGHIKYGFGGNTIFLRVYDSKMDWYLNKNLINAFLYSQHLVIDCSYEEHMNHIEAKNCARQLCMLFSENRYHRNPFHLQFCNVDQTSHTMKVLNRYIPPMYDKEFPIFTSPKSYLDLYPKEKLVYLTPHCRNDLMEYNHDDVYIVGAMVDKRNSQPLSLAKAKEQGIRMAKLPLERFLVWGTGASKCLTLNQVVAILLDRRDTGDWNKAFQHIPRRKLVTDDQLAEQGYRPAPKLKQRILKDSQSKTPGDVSLSSDILKRIKTPQRIDVSKLFD